MRKIILFNMVSVDGLFEGPDGNIDWHRTDEEFNDFAIDQLNSAGGLLFGRLTYQLMASYWPNAGQDDPDVAEKMNSLPKYVFSRTLQSADWENTRLVKDDAAAEVKRLKQEPGSDLFIFGSADLAAALTAQGLIDEYRLIINPVILGSGRPLFQYGQPPLKLKLVRTHTFKNGNVLLCYQPEPDSPA
jgi:dihydrofolate reductase